MQIVPINIDRIKQGRVMLESQLFKRKPLAILICAACALPAVSFAADETPENVEVMEVWGTEVSSNALLGSDIEMKQADHLSDLLRDQAGVDVGGSHSLNQGINIRGVSELDLDITIDGASQSNNVFHHAGNLLINPDIVQAVDIQVGNNSILNSGLGGGVAFETKDAKDLLDSGDRFGARVASGIASNDYYNYSLTLYSQLTEKLDALAYYSAVERNNPEDGSGFEQVGEEGKTENILVKLGWDANQANRLELSYDYYKDAGDYTIKSNMGPDYTGHEGNIRPIEYTRETITLNHELSLDNTEVRTTLYRNEMNYQSTTDDVSEGNTIVYGAKSVAETQFELANMYHTARYGIEGRTEQGEKLVNGEVVQNSSGVDSTETIDAYAVYLEDEIELIDGLFITPGVRYNVHKVDMEASNETFTDTLFALKAKYELTQNWTIRASATELFKGPGLTGSYIASESTVNPDLDPETGINYEAAIAYQAQNFIGLDQFGFSFTAFETHLDDTIDDTMTAKSSTYSNAGDVEVVGFESVMNMRSGNANASLSYSHSDSEYTSVTASSGYVVGQAVDDEVGDSIALNLGYELPEIGVTLNWTSLFTLDLDKDVEEDTEKEGYDVHDISATWTPNALKDLHITASIENIFDEYYGSHASHDFGYTDYEPGRNYKLSAAYKF